MTCMTCTIMSYIVIMYNHVYIEDIPVFLITIINVYVLYCYCIYVLQSNTRLQNSSNLNQ